ncbi:MAG: glycosyltransferase family 2 protein, partial [Nitrospirae bacterium]|nr:glycosyltransferase family 2 protein [Nitrospirota bacterium]
KDSPGYNGILHCNFNVSALSSCMIVKRENFIKTGGIDRGLDNLCEVDLSLRLRKMGLLIACIPKVEICLHAVYASKKKKDLMNKEKEMLLSRWQDELPDVDPYYNPNLTSVREDFSLRH